MSTQKVGFPKSRRLRLAAHTTDQAMHDALVLDHADAAKLGKRDVLPASKVSPSAALTRQLLRKPPAKRAAHLARATDDPAVLDRQPTRRSVAHHQLLNPNANGEQLLAVANKLFGPNPTSAERPLYDVVNHAISAHPTLTLAEKVAVLAACGTDVSDDAATFDTLLGDPSTTSSTLLDLLTAHPSHLERCAALSCWHAGRYGQHCHGVRSKLAERVLAHPNADQAVVDHVGSRIGFYDPALAELWVGHRLADPGRALHLNAMIGTHDSVRAIALKCRNVDPTLLVAAITFGNDETRKAVLANPSLPAEVFDAYTPLGRDATVHNVTRKQVRLNVDIDAAILAVLARDDVDTDGFLGNLAGQTLLSRDAAVRDAVVGWVEAQCTVTEPAAGLTLFDQPTRRFDTMMLRALLEVWQPDVPLAGLVEVADLVSC